MRRAAKAKPAVASKVRLAAAKKKTARARATKPRAAPAQAARIQLAPECTLREAAALQALLLATHSPTDSVVIEAGAVTRIDASALQLLVAFAMREAAAGRRLEWQAPSPELIESSARLGLIDLLGLPAGAVVAP